MNTANQMLVPGQFYHIFNRGNNGETIFIEPRNYTYFLTMYQKHVSPIAETYSYCLLKNHFHFLIRIKDEKNLPGFRNLEGFPLNLHQPFSNFFNAYVKGFNKTYKRHGSLFEKNFRRIRITTQTHLLNLVTYIHRNPQTHGFVSSFEHWPYSSFVHFFDGSDTFLKTQAVLSWFDGLENYLTAHQAPVTLTEIDA